MYGYRNAQENAPGDSDGIVRQRPETKGHSRPLYDIPYMFEAREFLRKKLVGKKVRFFCDFIIRYYNICSYFMSENCSSRQLLANKLFNEMVENNFINHS